MVSQDQSTLLNEMIDRIVQSCDSLSDPGWEDVFRRVPRHPFVSTFSVSRNGEESGEEYRRVDSSDPDWLTLVYSDTPLLTRLDESGRIMSSSSMPSIMARFLLMLDVQDGRSVLEIGTGAGYNAALLCERVGSDNVTSIDIDPACVGS